MSEEKKNKRRKLMKWFFFRIPISLIVIGAILIGALKIVERYPDPLRQGFEEYLSKATGRNATIGKLEEVKFFPNFIVKAKNITIHNHQNAAVIDLEVEALDISAPFFSVFVNSKNINSFSLKNLTANADMLTPKELRITSANIVTKDGPDQFGSFFIAEGVYAEKEMYFETELEVGSYSYKIPSPTVFSLRIGTHEVSGALNRGFKTVILEDVVFSVGSKQSEIKEYILLEKKEFNKNNPLSCILAQENLNDCNQYLVKEN